MENTDKLFEAIEHPERFSDEELSNLLKDSGVRELYEALSKTSVALTETSEPDIDREWERFAHTHLRKEEPKRTILGLSGFISRHAAASVAVVIVASLAVVAASIGVKYSHIDATPDPTTLTDDRSVNSETVGKQVPMIDEVTGDSQTEEPETIVFKNVSAESIIKAVSDYYGVSVTFASSTAGNLRLYFNWDQSQSLDEVIDQLNNFEHIDIVFENNTLTVE